MGIGTAIAAVGIGASLIGGSKSSKAQKQAAQAQAAADTKKAKISSDLELKESQVQAQAELDVGDAAYEIAVLESEGKYFEARQLKYQAGQERAASQRTAQEETRQARLKQSRAVALAAASGGTATDVSVVDLLSDIEGEGEYEALTAIYEGGERARLMETNALVRRIEGDKALHGGSITYDASRKRYASIIASGKRRAQAMIEAGDASAGATMSAGKAAATATMWGAISGSLSKASSLFG